MTVADLIALLQTEDPERLVVMSKDSEGNGYSPLADLGTGAYCADSTWSGGIGIEALTPELIEDGYTKDDVLKGKKALVLWPTN